MFSIYDDGLLRFFSQLKIDGAVPMVFAAPDRAFSAIEQWVLENKGESRSKLSGFTAVPYPFGAIWREPFVTNKALTNPAIHRDLWIDTEHLYGYAMRSPKAVTASVSLNLYVSHLAHFRSLEWQLHNLFPDDYGNVSIDYGEAKWYLPPNDRFQFAQVLGQRDITIGLDQIADNTTIEDSGKVGRTLRLTVGCTLNGFIPFEPYALPVMNTLEFPIYNDLDDPPSLVTTFTISKQ